MLRKNLIFDCEVYPNYTLFLFKDFYSGEIYAFEIKAESSRLKVISQKKIINLLRESTIIGFNSTNYDIPILAFSLKGTTAKRIYNLSKWIINESLPGWKTIKDYDLFWPDYADHIDLINLCPGVAGLKLYGARMHSKSIIGLPINPHFFPKKSQMEEIKAYCVNDLTLTNELFNKLKNKLKLRLFLNEQYKLDFRSKSDAQIAETIIKFKLNLEKTKKIKITKKTYKYNCPEHIKFQSKIFKELSDTLNLCEFKSNTEGYIKLPKAISNFKIKLGNLEYKFGMGGLHSKEPQNTISPNNDETLVNIDVTSFYPSLIVNSNLYPEHLTTRFLEIYKNLVEDRIKAKKVGNLEKSDSLKIIINSVFGKFGSPHSVLYSPQSLINVTITGQLLLLLLIENLEVDGFEVVSANTDGLICLLKKERKDSFDKICSEWEKLTNCKLEETLYKALYSRDVNNYLAVTTYGGNLIRKGFFSESGLSKNPHGQICVRAAINYLLENIPVEQTIKSCKDIKEFIFTRAVNKGIYFNSMAEPCKVVRWVWVNPKVSEEVINRPGFWKQLYSGGKKVANATNCRPMMILNNNFEDIDYNRYIREADTIIKSVKSVVDNQFSLNFQ